MKKPYLDFWQRQNIIQNTCLGAALRLNIELKKVCRTFQIEIEKINIYMQNKNI